MASRVVPISDKVVTGAAMDQPLPKRQRNLIVLAACVLLPVLVAAEAQRVGDGLFQQVQRHAGRPAGALAQEALNKRYVEDRLVGADVQCVPFR